MNKFDRETGTFKYYSIHNGLPDNVVYGILEDEYGNLWLSTNNGLSKFDPKTKAKCIEKYKNIEISRTAIRLRKRIVFAEKQANIPSDSRETLDEISRFLADNPQITLEIQGHTDSAGDSSRNLKISQKRADAVRDYLIKTGIKPARLVAKGYGETTPIESNQTSRGRAANRRIEIIRTR